VANEVEHDLWEKADAARRRYFKWVPSNDGDAPRIKAMREIHEGAYRTGWIMGYRAGARSKKNRGSESMKGDK
jgi:hypothetical protein